jgi:hypothetical protein
LTAKLVTIVFSKDRAMQLHGALRSLFLHCRDPARLDVKVLYTTSRYETQYQALQKEFDAVEFIQEGDFQADVTALVQSGEYVMFAVDDLLFSRSFSVEEVLASLNADDVMAFLLHTGRNTTHCYPLRCPITGCEFVAVADGIFKYDWRRTNIRYPFDVSAAAYTAGVLQPLLELVTFGNPSELEWNVNAEAERRECGPYIAVYDTSVCFINPVNLVQTNYPDNRINDEFRYTVGELAQKFDAGLRIEVEAYRNFETNSAHFEADLMLR